MGPLEVDHPSLYYLIRMPGLRDLFVDMEDAFPNRRSRLVF